jgi:hypothetical protein
MAIQARTDLYSLDFIRGGNPLTKSNETVLRDAGRVTAVAKYTVMAYNPTTTKWVPLTDVTATTGVAYPRGILLASLTAAEVAAADVSDVPILVGDAIVDANQLEFEGGVTLATIINIPTNTNTTVEVELRKLGIFVEATRDVDGFENA